METRNIFVRRASLGSGLIAPLFDANFSSESAQRTFILNHLFVDPVAQLTAPALRPKLFAAAHGGVANEVFRSCHLGL